MYINNIGALTENYASPNVHAGVSKINHYLEDVFSLGLTFLQMARLFKETELEKFRLNKEAPFDDGKLLPQMKHMSFDDYKQMNKAN